MKIDSNSLDSTIRWVCSDCGRKAMQLPENKGKRAFQISTYHTGECDVCKQRKAVTETRDFMFPVFEMEELK